MYEFDRSTASAPTAAWCHCSNCASGMSLMSCGLKGNNQQQVHRILGGVGLHLLHGPSFLEEML